MGFFESVNSVFAGYFKFSGRATRAEFWWFFLFEIIVGGLAFGIDAYLVFSTLNAANWSETALLALSPFDFMLVYYMLITFFPRMTVTVRRLHDVGLSGFFYLMYFVPFVGGLIVFVLTLLPSEQDTNIHGPGPFQRGGGTPLPTGGPAGSGGAPKRKHDPMQGYAVLDKIKEEPTPEMLAARKAEVRALYEQRVLGKGPIVAE